MDTSPFPQYNLFGAEPPPDLNLEDSYQCHWDYSEWDIFTSNINGGNSFDEYPGLDGHSNQRSSQAQPDHATPRPDLGAPPPPPQQSTKAIPGDQDAQTTTASKYSQKTQSKRRREGESSKVPKTLHNSAVQRPRQKSNTAIVTESLISNTGPPINSDEEEEDANATGPDIEASAIFKPKPRDEVALAKNRISARKCRKRKQVENTTLNSKEQEMEQTNIKLSQCAKELAEEVRCLKMMLLNHAECDSKLILDYIKMEAEKFVERTIKARMGTPGLSPGSGSVTESFASLQSPE